MVIGIARTLAVAALFAAGSMAPAGAFVLGPTNPGKWGPPTMGTGATVSWSLMPSGLDVADDEESVALADFMPAGFKAAIEAAFDAWSAIANIAFEEKTDPGVDWQAAGAAAVDIRIAGHVIDGPGSTLAHSYFPPVNGGALPEGAAAGDFFFDIGEDWDIGFGGTGFDIFQVAAHEIGHSIGLDHVMESDALMYDTYSETFRGPQADDIAGAQHIYGPRQVTPPRVVPVPPALPLLMAALGLLGFLGRAPRRAAA